MKKRIIAILLCAAMALLLAACGSSSGTTETKKEEPETVEDFVEDATSHRLAEPKFKKTARAGEAGGEFCGGKAGARLGADPFDGLEDVRHAPPPPARRVPARHHQRSYDNTFSHKGHRVHIVFVFLCGLCGQYIPKHLRGFVAEAFEVEADARDGRGRSLPLLLDVVDADEGQVVRYAAMLFEGEPGNVGGGAVGRAEDAAAGREVAHEGVEARIARRVRLPPMREGEKRQLRLPDEGGEGASALP